MAQAAWSMASSLTQVRPAQLQRPVPPSATMADAIHLPAFTMHSAGLWACRSCAWLLPPSVPSRLRP